MVFARNLAVAELDPRAEEDEAFVAKLGERETQAAEEIGSTISSPSFEETKK